MNFVKLSIYLYLYKNNKYIKEKAIIASYECIFDVFLITISLNSIKWSHIVFSIYFVEVLLNLIVCYSFLLFLYLLAKSF